MERGMSMPRKRGIRTPDAGPKSPRSAGVRGQAEEDLLEAFEQIVQGVRLLALALAGALARHRRASLGELAGPGGHPVVAAVGGVPRLRGAVGRPCIFRFGCGLRR